MKKIKLTAFLLCLFVAAQTAVAAKKAKEITLTSDNTVVLDEPFTGKSVGVLAEKVNELDSKLKSDYPIYLFLNTPGGEIQYGLELIEFFNGINRPIHTVTLFAASMGFQTVQHLGKRYILNYGVLMSHYARGGSRGNFGGTQMPSTKRSYDQLWERRIDMMDLKAVERTNGKQTIQSYRQKYMFDMWLNGPEAVSEGFADEVVVVKCDASLSGVEQKTITFAFFALKATFSKCPIRTAPLSVGANILTNKGFMDLNEFVRSRGKFGDKCRRKEAPAVLEGFEVVTPLKPAELCAEDPNLTHDKLLQEIKQYRKEISKNYQEKVLYNY